MNIGKTKFKIFICVDIWADVLTKLKTFRDIIAIKEKCDKLSPERKQIPPFLFPFPLINILKKSVSNFVTYLS